MQYWHKKIWTRNINRFIVATEFTKAKYVEVGIPSSLISVKPHFVKDPGRSGDIHQRTHALFVGRLSHEKGIKVLLEAWRGIKDLPLYIMGKGPMEAEIKEYISKNKLDNVTLLACIDAQIYKDLMRKARFVIIPSLCYENFPRIVVEAFAYGVPVLASRRGSLPEVVSEGSTGALFEPGNSSDLATKAYFLNGHPEFTANARKKYENCYTPEVNGKYLLKIYEETLVSARN